MKKTILETIVLSVFVLVALVWCTPTPQVVEVRSTDMSYAEYRQNIDELNKINEVAIQEDLDEDDYKMIFQERVEKDPRLLAEVLLAIDEDAFREYVAFYMEKEGIEDNIVYKEYPIEMATRCFVEDEELKTQALAIVKEALNDTHLDMDAENFGFTSVAKCKIVMHEANGHIDEPQ